MAECSSESDAGERPWTVARLESWRRLPRDAKTCHHAAVELPEP